MISPFANVPHTDKTEIRCTRMSFFCGVHTVDWNATAEQHRAMFDDLLIDFIESFEETLLTIIEQTEFDYHVSTDSHLGFDVDVESLFSWSPEWLICAPTNLTLFRRLPRDYVRTEIENRLSKAASQLSHDDRAKPELVFHWTADYVYIWINFEYESA